MKRIIIAVPVVILTLLAVLIVAPSFIDWSVYKARAQSQIKAITGYDVELNGKLNFAFIPTPHATIENVVVKAPQGSSKENLAQLERLQASVALLPLFSGDVKISAVELVKPQIALEVMRDDKPNWMTPELEAMMGAKKAEERPSGNAQAISLDRLSIEDGQFFYTKGGKTTELSNIDLDVKADTLQGPFEVSGAMGFGGQPLTFEAKVGEMEQGAQSVSLSAQGDYNGIKMNYAGAVEFGEAPGLQGETKIQIASLAQTAKNFGAKDTPLSGESASLAGLLTATPEKLTFKNAALKVGQYNFAADFSTQLSPLYIGGTFRAADTVNLDTIMPPKKGAQGSGDITALTKILPETLSFPMPFGADITFTMPGMIYNNQVYNGVSVALAKKDKSIQVKIAANQIPGKGKFDAAVDLTFAEKSISQKTGGEIYSSPSMAFNMTAETPDLPFTLQAVSGKPASLAFKSLALVAKGYLKPGKIEVNDANITLDGKPYNVSGALAGQSLLVNANVFGGSVILKGDLTKDAKLSNTALQVTHPNLAKGLQELSGAKTQNDMLAQKLDFYTKLDQEGTKYKLSDMKATLGQTGITGALSYDGGGSKPSVTGDLKLGDLVLQSKGGSSAGASTGGAKTSDRWSKAPIDTAWMNLANVDLAIAANSIKYETWDLSQPKLQFTLQDGVLNIKDLSSGLYQGSVALSGTARPISGGGLGVELKTSMTSIQMEPLVKSLFNNRIIKGKGSISSETSIQASGASHAALINSLSGQGTATGSAIVIEGIDINRFARALSEESKPGDSLLHLWKGTATGGSTAFDTLDGAFTIQNGVVTLSKMDLDGARGAIATKGTINLPAWTIQTAHTMSVKDRDDVPDFTINISGSLDNPGQTFAQGAIQDYLQRKLSRKLEKVLNEELSKKLDGSPLGGALGGFLGQPQQQQQAPANDNTQQQPAQEQPQQQQQTPSTPEEAFQGILKGLMQ
ncbi:MAG: AsmA family protein [Alphaproteobacteria bacterium]|nr:AsmA family protein [Alphaproteobacteria bacterium]